MRSRDIIAGIIVGVALVLLSIAAYYSHKTYNIALKIQDNFEITSNK